MTPEQIAAIYEDAARIAEARAPDPAGGPHSHTNSMRVIASDCASAIRARAAEVAANPALIGGEQ